MACMSLGRINKNLIPVLIGCVFCFLNRLLNKYDGTLLFNNHILINIYISISRLLTVIPFIILKIRSKRDNYNDNNDIIHNKTFELIYNDYKEENVQGKFKYILLSAIIYLINSICFVVSFKIKTNSWIWYILITSIFYYLIFKVQMYNHHYLSSILIIILGLIIDLVQENIQNEIVHNLFNLIMKFQKEISFSLYNVLAKYVMEKKYVSVYEFSFHIGLFNSLLLILFSVFDYYFFEIGNYKEYFTNFNYIEILVMLGEIFTQLGINICTLFTTKNNSPCHVFIIFVFGQLAYYINIRGYSILVIICLIFILFLSLIFNEIIEINIFGLSKNTKRNIIDRAESESSIQNEIIDENDENSL